MLRLRRSLRVFGLLWAVLQFALPGTVAVLDGATALRGDADVASHVEATSGKSCQPPHSAECGICRYLSAGGVNDGGVDAPAWASLTSTSLSDGQQAIPASYAAARPRARAPPLS